MVKGAMFAKKGSGLQWALMLAAAALFVLVGCSNRRSEQIDNPRLVSGARLQQVTFHSNALRRDVTYRVVLPEASGNTERFSVIYLLHGGDGSFRDWLNYSDVAKYSAASKVLLVMPDADESYYTNSATKPDDRYEDFIISDLIHDVEARFPVQNDRAHRSIVGVSMGGFGAVNIALRHPELFGFVGGMSSALDVPSRPFSWKRIGQWRHHRSIFGPWNGTHQEENDPFLLAEAADRSKVPFFYLTCGNQEGLLAANRKFDKLLTARGVSHEFHVTSGGHNWSQWNSNLPALFDAWHSHPPPEGGK